MTSLPESETKDSAFWRSRAEVQQHRADRLEARVNVLLEQLNARKIQCDSASAQTAMPLLTTQSLGSAEPVTATGQPENG